MSEHTPNAKCECGVVMTPGNRGCRFKYLADSKGKAYKRVPYGSESMEWGDGPCHDCNASKGTLHHTNCDVEECPKCKTQLLSCACDFPMQST